MLSSPATLLEERPSFFKQFSLVVATQVGPGLCQGDSTWWEVWVGGWVGWGI